MQNNDELRGQLAAWEAIAREALKLLTPDQIRQIQSSVHPGLVRGANEQARGAASIVVASLSRQMPRQR